VHILDLGRRIRVTNTGGSDVTVAGYLGEPYLRIGPKGAYENRKSPTTYLNRPGSPSPPASATATATPEWHRLSGARSVTWRDQRTRWEGADPAIVKAAPGTSHVVRSFTIGLTPANGRGATISGEVAYVPPPERLGYALLAAGLLILALAAGWSRRWPLLLSAALGLLVAVDVVHSIGLAAYGTSNAADVVGRLLSRSLITPLLWGLGVWAVAGLQIRQERAVLLAIGVGVVVAVVGGVTDIASVTHSQVPASLTPTAARLAVAASVGLGLGVAAGAGLALRRHLSLRRAS
jgi:hypothetical protein